MEENKKQPIDETENGEAVSELQTNVGEGSATAQQTFDDTTATEQDDADIVLEGDISMNEADIENNQSEIDSKDESVFAYPQYRSHKVVQAFKIGAVVNSKTQMDGGATLVPEDKSLPPLRVDYLYMKKHSPRSGGYYVVYEDGYESWSPADAFEDGYSLVGESQE